MEHKIEKPKYNPACLRNLEKRLGRSDSAVEWIEVAIRNLEREEVKGADHMESIAKNVGVRVNSVPLAEIYRRWAGMQVISVNQFADAFFQEFRGEVPRDWGTKDKQEDMLTFLIREVGSTRKGIGSLEVDIFDYYRGVRNHLMHAPGAPQEKAEAKKATRIRSRVETSQYARLNAPRSIEELGFDDFVLYSRVTKGIARRLCLLGTPTVDHLAPLLFPCTDLRAALRKVVGNEPRALKILVTYLCTHFGFARPLAEDRARELESRGLLVQLVERPPPSGVDGAISG